jgi:predicted RNA-binding protein Jag
LDTFKENTVGAIQFIKSNNDKLKEINCDNRKEQLDVLDKIQCLNNDLILHIDRHNCQVDLHTTEFAERFQKSITELSHNVFVW